MDINDIGNMSINSLGDYIKQAQSLVQTQKSKLSASDIAKVDKIVNGVDKGDMGAMTELIKDLNKQKDAI
jgi:hypothetical protein